MRKKVKKATLKKAIEQLTEEFNKLDPSSEEATKVANNIKTLSEALDKCPKIKGDTVVCCGASIATTAMLIAFERNNCFTTKLLSFIPKIRLR